jgi:hypothetical protein
MSLVITNSTEKTDKAIETSVTADMFVKGHYQRPNDTNSLIVPISAIKHNISSQLSKAKANGFLNQPVKTYNLSKIG